MWPERAGGRGLWRSSAQNSVSKRPLHVEAFVTNCETEVNEGVETRSGEAYDRLPDLSDCVDPPGAQQEGRRR